MKFLKVAQQTLAVLTEIILHRSRCPKCLFIACLKGFFGHLSFKDFSGHPKWCRFFPSTVSMSDVYIYIYYTHVILLSRPIIDPGNL